MIELNARPTTILVGLVLVGAALWASVYLTAALTQALFLVVVLVILAVMWGIGQRVKKMLAGERRRGGD